MKTDIEKHQEIVKTCILTLQGFSSLFPENKMLSKVISSLSELDYEKISDTYYHFLSLNLPIDINSPINFQVSTGNKNMEYSISRIK